MKLPLYPLIQKRLYSFDSEPDTPYTLDLKKQYDKLLQCGEKITVTGCPYCLVGQCNQHIVKPNYCHNKYCTNPECKNVVYSQALNRLMNRSVRSRKLYHFVIGSCFLGFNELRKSVLLVIRALRHGNKYRSRHKYNMFYDMVFDVGRKNYNKHGHLWLHFHIAILPEKGFVVSEFMKDVESVLPGGLEFQNIGYRNKENIYDYFAKRTAGILGHKKTGYYYYPELMSFPSYHRLFYKKHVLTHGFPVGLVYSTATMETKSLVCSDHLEPYIFIICMKKDVYQRFGGFKDSL